MKHIVFEGRCCEKEGVTEMLPSRLNRVHKRAWLVLYLMLTVHRGAEATDSRGLGAAHKRAISVADVVSLTRVASRKYFYGQAAGPVALFSPNGEKFVVVLRKASLDQNTNTFSMLLFQTAEVFQAAKPDCVVSLTSSSNRDAISNVRWLPDNETLTFLGEDVHEVTQLYSVNTTSHQLRKLTQHATPLSNYDLSADGRTMAFEAEAPQEKNILSAEARRTGVVIEGVGLAEKLIGNYSDMNPGLELFLQTQSHQAVRIPVGERYYLREQSQLLFSPNGRYLVIGVSLRDVPDSWMEYQDPYLRTFLSGKRVKGVVSSESLALVYDSENASVEPLMNAPASGRNGEITARWEADSEALYFRTYLPLDVSDPREREARTKASYPVKVDLRSRETRRITDQEWPNAREMKPAVDVSLEEGPNNPPKLWASAPSTEARTLLFDLNPQLSELDLGKVEVLNWKVGRGMTVQGGLYFPPNYQPGHPYPLVIQTHGFFPGRFSMDGMNEWSSGYAARMLAAKGVLVLQAFGFESESDRHQHYFAKEFGSTPEQADRNFSVAAWESAIDYLDGRGLIDRDRVGIVGFSRTVCFVAYMLTHSRTPIAAAALVDGIDCGYFQEMAYPFIAWDVDAIYGGLAPFAHGLGAWLKEAPSFSLDKVNVPVRLLALRPSGVLMQWEWYSGLLLQNKPVDFLLIPDEEDGDNHFLVKPWERRIAQQSLVDWFTFWLKDERDPDPTKAKQYDRWEKLVEKRGLDRQAAGCGGRKRNERGGPRSSGALPQ